MTDPNIAMQQFVAAGLDVVRGAFVDSADDAARARAARVCRLILHMLETASPAQVIDAPPYAPAPPPPFAAYLQHLMQNPQELSNILGPLAQMLGPAAPMAFGMVRSAFARPAAPIYR